MLRSDSGECAGGRRVRPAADMPSGRRALDGVAVDDRCAETGFGAAHHGGRAVFRIREAGPQGQAAQPDFIEAGGGSPDYRGSAPSVDCGFAYAAVAGLFQYSGGSFVRFTGAGRSLPEAGPAELDSSITR